MADTPYTYSLANDFPNHIVDSDRLTLEIQQSAITIALESIGTAGDVVTITFKAELSGDEVTILNAIVAAHTGEPLPQNTAIKTMLYASDEVPVPTTTDGRPVIQNSFFPTGVLFYATGAGDAPGGARGAGPAFIIQSTSAGDTAVEFCFNDSVQFGGGYLSSRNGNPGDEVTFQLHAPASTVVPNVDNAGNCHLVGPKIIPNPNSDGTHDVDLSTAVPVLSLTNKGYFDWSDPTTGKGVVTISETPGAARFDLYAIDLQLVRSANRIQLVPDSDKRFDLPIAAKKILPHWKFVVTVHNAGDSTELLVTWVISAARAQTL